MCNFLEEKLLYNCKSSPHLDTELLYGTVLYICIPAPPPPFSPGYGICIQKVLYIYKWNFIKASLVYLYPPHPLNLDFLQQSGACSHQEMYRLPVSWANPPLKPSMLHGTMERRGLRLNSTHHTASKSPCKRIFLPHTICVYI